MNEPILSQGSSSEEEPPERTKVTRDDLRPEVGELPAAAALYITTRKRYAELLDVAREMHPDRVSHETILGFKDDGNPDYLRAINVGQIDQILVNRIIPEGEYFMIGIEAYSKGEPYEFRYEDYPESSTNFLDIIVAPELPRPIAVDFFDFIADSKARPGTAGYLQEYIHKARTGEYPFFELSDEACVQLITILNDPVLNDRLSEV